MGKKIVDFYKGIIRTRWELGIVQGGLDGIFSNNGLNVDWIKNPFTDRWFADPFILDVTDHHIILLAEEYRYANPKGRIARLLINRKTLVIEDFKIVLEIATHLSFPCIYRKNGKVFVCPESAASGRLDLYEYDGINDGLVFIQTICNDTVWDSVLTDVFGEELLFTANKSDYYLDIYKWSPELSTFTQSQSIQSPLMNSRMAGQFFKYNGDMFCPQQDCERVYGGAVDINQVRRDENGFHFSHVKKIESPHKTRKEALHTLNEYKGVVVIDVKGYDHPLIGKTLHKIVKSF